jgi:hypothetical protein
MLDRQKVETILTRRFPGAAYQQVAAAANAIMGLGEEWEEIADDNGHFAHHVPPHCGDMCYLARATEEGTELRLFRRRDY